MTNENFNEALSNGPDWEAIASSLGVPIETLEFFYEALEAAPHYRGVEPDDIDAMATEHSSPTQFCDAITEFARQCFGAEYRRALATMGIATSEDLGRITCTLVGLGLVESEDTDQQQDFQGRFNFSEFL